MWFWWKSSLRQWLAWDVSRCIYAAVAAMICQKGRKFSCCGEKVMLVDLVSSASCDQSDYVVLGNVQSQRNSVFWRSSSVVVLFISTIVLIPLTWFFFSFLNFRCLAKSITDSSATAARKQACLKKRYLLHAPFGF